MNSIKYIAYIYTLHTYFNYWYVQKWIGSNWSIELLFLKYYYSSFTLRFRCNQIEFYVHLLQARLQMVNQKIADILERLRNTCMENTDIQDMSNYNDLLSLKGIYGKIYYTSQLINENFGCSMLIVFLQNFIEFTRQMYMFVKLNMNGRSISGFFSIWSLIQIIKLSVVHVYFPLLCYSCSTKVNIIYVCLIMCFI